MRRGVLVGLGLLVLGIIAAMCDALDDDDFPARSPSERSAQPSSVQRRHPPPSVPSDVTIEPSPVPVHEPSPEPAIEPPLPESPPSEPLPPESFDSEQAEAPSAISPPTADGSLEQLQRAFARAPRDPEASKTEARIRDMFGSDELPEETLVGVVCRALACRVTVEWSRARPLAYTAALMMVAHGINFDIAIDPRGEPDAQGVMQVDLYVLREGYELADLE